LILNFMLDGAPRPEEVAGFFAALGVLVLGAAAFTSLSLFFSTLTKSTVVSLLLTLGAWIIVLPLIGQIGLFSTIGDDSFEGDFDDVRIDWSRYLNPGSDMSVAGKILVPNDEDRGVLDFLSFPPKHTSVALLALGAHTAGWFGLSMLIVQRRNFE
jgi:ABC-type transport system involved in multi-copper enzyme maturation permease subunit